MKRKIWHRAGALLVSLALCVGMMPAVPVWAEEAPPIETVAADTGDWKVQKWSGNTDITGQVQEGWLVPTENGITINYEQPMADSDVANCVIYNAAAERYADSELSFDLKMPWRQDPGRFQVAILPRFESGALCEGLAINENTVLQHTVQNNGESWPGVENKLNKAFGTEETYHFRIVTQGNRMTAYLSVNGGEEQELTSFETSTSLQESTYGFRLWGFQKNVEITNISRRELLPEDSALEKSEESVAFSDWGKADVEIPVRLAEGDSVASLSNEGEILQAGADYAVTESGILLKADYIARQQGSFTLGVAFAKGATASFTLIREQETIDADGWKVQKQGTSEETPLQEGWVTVSDEGNKVVIDYGKMCEDVGQGWVVFDSDEPQYKDSILEYDITFSNCEDPGWFATVLALRVLDGANYEGMAITSENSLEMQGRRNGQEKYAGIANQAGVKFEYGKTYHVRMETVGSSYTVYITQPDGKEQKLTGFTGPVGIEKGSYGFRLWRGGKTITLENIERREIITSKMDKMLYQVEKDLWGKEDISMPGSFGVSTSGGVADTVASITNGTAKLEPDKDYTVTDHSINLKADYIASQKESFRLQIEFEQGSKATVWVMQYQPGEMKEYVWTPDQGIDMWAKMDGNGTFEMTEAGLHITDKNVLINTMAPIVQNGEVEISFDMLNDNGEDDIGALFRADVDAGTWQSGISLNAEDWGFRNNEGFDKKVVNMGTNFNSREGVKALKMKVRFDNDNLTFFMDDEFVGTYGIDSSKMQTVLGNMGLYTNDGADIVVKKVFFRELQPFQEEKGEQQTVSIEKNGLTVRLDKGFPRVVDYQLNGKTLNGSPVRYNYVTVNAVDMPATAEIVQTEGDSVTYHVTPDPKQTGVTFDVKFTVKEDNIVEMLLLNIHEPEDELVYSIGLPRQPMISADSTDPSAQLAASHYDGNSSGIYDVIETIADKKISQTADRTATIPIITSNGLSAAMMNNVFVDRFEFLFRAFDLGDGKVAAGFWNTPFFYRGLDDEKILPFPTEPDEENLYCRVAITEDTNGDDVVNWQDGANALKKLNGDLIPGGDQAARSFFHIGYNFASGVQHPFIQVADNMKRLSNYMDGFSQQLIFKGYANEGHDSGHADFYDINRRAGGAQDMNTAITEVDKIHSNLGIHINTFEAYPEAKMYSDHLIADRDNWYWMDQAKLIRRELDMLEGSFDQRMDAMFQAVPNLDYVYVDCWWGYRWDQLKLIGNMVRNGAEIFATENGKDMNRFGVLVHSPIIDSSSIHHFVYHTQKDVYKGNSMYWGGGTAAHR